MSSANIAASPANIAAQVLDLVRAADPTAEAEVLVDHTDRALTRFANSFIHQNVAESSRTIRLRVHTDGRTSAGTTTRTEADQLPALVQRTLNAARLSPRDAQWPGLTPPMATRTPPAIDQETAYADPADRAERVRAFVAAAGPLETAGYCSTLRWSMTFANSAGQAASAEAAEAVLDGIARCGGSDGMTRLTAGRLADIDGTVLGSRAARKARAGADPVELAPGRYEVVLEPTAVADILHFLAIYGFNGKAFAERRSFVELGTRQFDPSITLVDDPMLGAGTGLPFDVEGTPRPRLTLVEAGVSTSLTHDRRSAAEVGGASTGHAMTDRARDGSIATNLLLSPADSAGISRLDEVDSPAADSAVMALVSSVERGLLVTDYWYTRVLDPRTLVVTGLTRNGVWLIDDGEITKPVQNLRFTQGYAEALAPGQVLSIGSHTIPTPSGWSGHTFHAPALRLASWNFTGNASG